MINIEQKNILKEKINEFIKKNRNWEKELEERSNWIKNYVESQNIKGIVLGASGGKDCALVSILCKHAGINVLNVSMPCGNLKADENDARKFAKLYDIPFMVIDLSTTFDALVKSIEKNENIKLKGLELANLKPRLRMTTLYAKAATLGYLVGGTGNRSEITIGYFTKHGDGACDINPISDLTVHEIYDFLKYLSKKDNKDLNFIIDRQPSAGLYEGQTDELELGFSYEELDAMIFFENSSLDSRMKILNKNLSTKHKRISTNTVYCNCDFELSPNFFKYNLKPLV